VRVRWPFIGRSEEMRAIEAAILASDVAGIVVHGAAGVGKSRIVREALLAAESHGCEGRLAVGASSARTIPPCCTRPKTTRGRHMNASATLTGAT
jgi:hypothetical protein